MSIYHHPLRPSRQKTLPFVADDAKSIARTEYPERIQFKQCNVYMEDNETYPLCPKNENHNACGCPTVRLIAFSDKQDSPVAMKRSGMGLAGAERDRALILRIGAR